MFRADAGIEKLETLTNVQDSGALGGGATSPEVERGLVLGRKLACALRNVENDAERGSLQLVGQVAAATGQLFDNVVRAGNEIDCELVNVKLLVIKCQLFPLWFGWLHR